MEAEISIKKSKNGKAKVLLNGDYFAVLVTLAGLEKAILRETGISQHLWGYIKDTVNTMEANNE